ncbi:protein FAM217A isoform X2 [Erinaceus europaeus]|uniref:Protein FAM217A isoform X2 n=1 Tax=Erinaceus europaeus TaxID=9365 RepID=A0ABM3X8H5_ERIEU|nr:protein FAM217A isoform X2 [Erinaceus europaeus]
MSRLTQRAVVSPEHLPLCLGGCEKISWLPEGKVFSNVQREKIISKFLKESVLKRVFRSKQMRWEDLDYQKEGSSDSFPDTRKQAAPEGAPGQPLGLHAEGRALRSDGALGDHIRDSSWGCGAVGILKKQKSSSNKMGRRNGEHGGTNLQMSNIGHENLSHWNLELEPVPENKNFLPGRENASGGKINKNHLEIPVEQLMVELNLSDHTHKRIQNNKAGIFQLWSYPLNDGSTTENRDLKKKPSLDTGYNITNNPMRLFGANNPLTNASVDKQVGSYHGLQVPFSLSWPYADGDFLKGRTEPHITLYSTTENNDGETIFAPNWNLKYGCSSMEENLTDESDLSENEKANDTLLNYFKKMDLNLKPETIETVEDSFTEESSEIFPYPDFLPPPFNTLDLHKLALSKSDNWKATVEPPESSIDRLMTRLLEMERLQHITVQKERPRLQSTFYTSVVTERPSSSKAIPKMRQPKLSDSLSLQTTCADKSREKRRTNSGSYKLEQAASKWNWGSAGKYKWNSRPTKSSSSTRPLVATYDECKNPKSSILIPCQELSAKPTSAQTNQSLVKMISTRCLPPRSPIAVSPIPLSFPENPREEIKAARTKKKLYRKNIVLNRPFYIQKLNCLSPSFTVKGKCSPTDQK